MSEQNGTNVSTKPRRSLQTTKQNGTQQTTLQPPTSDDKEQLAYQRKFLPFFVSHLLDFISGYGYRPWLAFRAYVLVIIAFALAYYIIDHKVGPGSLTVRLGSL